MLFTGPAPFVGVPGAVVNVDVPILTSRTFAETCVPNAPASDNWLRMTSLAVRTLLAPVSSSMRTTQEKLPRAAGREKTGTAKCPVRLVSHHTVGEHFRLTGFMNCNELLRDPLGSVPVPIIGCPSALVTIVEDRFQGVSQPLGIVANERARTNLRGDWTFCVGSHRQARHSQGRRFLL